jgi:hypothetical protein
MKTKKLIDRDTFLEKYESKEQCLEYLAKQKWIKGYECKRCRNAEYIGGKQHFSRRCKKCGYDESATAHTLFHKLKFDISKAFGMVYDIIMSKKGANSIWLSERYEVSQNTAWLFRHKVQVAMKDNNDVLLEGEVHVDEFEVGTPKKGQQGRSKSKEKIRCVIAIEIKSGKCGKAYCKQIEDFSFKSLKTLFDEHIDKNAKIKTDKWTGYQPLKQEYPYLEQELSEKGLNFPMIHYQIRNFKNWLRGMHSFCKEKYFVKYINEFFYRFNRRNNRVNLVERLIQNMIDLNPITFKQIINLDI